MLLPPFHEAVVGRKQLLHSTVRPFDGANAKVDGRHLGVKAASREGIEGEWRAADLILIIGEENLADQTQLGE